jgi:hypothetical protein
MTGASGADAVPAGQGPSAEEELAALERVLTRLALTDDDKLEQVWAQSLETHRKGRAQALQYRPRIGAA